MYTDNVEQTALAAANAITGMAMVNEASAGVASTPTGEAMKSSPHLGSFGDSEFWGFSLLKYR